MRGHGSVAHFNVDGIFSRNIPQNNTQHKHIMENHIDLSERPDCLSVLAQLAK